MIRARVSIAESINIRLSEWALGLIMFMWGTILLIQPDVFLKPALQLMGQTASQEVWGYGMTVVGASRLAVLMVNGGWRRSPHLRALTAFLSCFAWAQISLSIIHSDAISPGLATYPTFVLIDIFVVFRAATEARRSDEASNAATP